MKLHETAGYPGATPGQVFDIIRDDEFRAEVCEKMHCLAYEVTVEDDDDTVRVQIDRTMPAELPDFIKKLTGDTIDVRQIETWGPAQPDGSRSGTVRLTIKGQPVEMDGTMVIVATADGAALVVDGELKVKIPLIGKKVEPEVAKAVVGALRIESREGLARFQAQG